jgi:hypothetical protein
MMPKAHLGIQIQTTVDFLTDHNRKNLLLSRIILASYGTERLEISESDDQGKVE